MIRQALTTLFCSVTFFLIAFVIPVKAEHITGAPYFCTTMEAAMETTRLQQADTLEVLRDRAESDVDFKCWFDNFNTRFYPVELVYEYVAYDALRGVITALAPDGSLVYLFGTMKYIDELLHQTGA